MATIWKRGKGRWCARVRKEGHRQVSRTFSTKGAAEAWARETERAIEQGYYTDATEARRTRLDEAIERYIAEVTVRHKGAKREADRLRWWARLRFARQPLAALRAQDFAEVRDRRLEQVSPTTVRNDLATISPLFEHARREWGMETVGNPARAIRWPSPARHRDRRLAPEEEKALRAAARGPYQLAWLTLALETAMRRGELLAMRWDQIDRVGGVAHIPDTKIGAPRDVPLSPAACEALDALPRRLDGAVWPWGSEGAASMWARWTARAGVDDLRFHDLRHEATSRLVESGRFEVTEVAAITGHQSMQTLARYTHHRARDLAARMRQG